MNKNHLPSEQAQPFKSMATIHSWKYSALAAATLASLALYTPNALALALGPVTVKSALGEPLRAEIELPSITASEAESLKVSTAPAETFRAQGMEYSGVVSQIQVALQKGPGGRSFLRVSSSRPVSEPFVDLVIDATWATGRITRSYTMLFDPPAAQRRPAEAVTAVPQLSTPSAAPARANTPPTARTVVPTVAPRTTASSATSSTNADNVNVKAGDTAGRIANANRPQGVSLDQMLVAMLRANPNAFIRGNVNLVKAGAVLQMPDAEQAGATSAAEARKTIAAQSRDFNNYRSKLAAAAPAAPASAEPASRSASGTVQTQVQEEIPTSESPDKLTLSKGAVKGTEATPEALAKRKQSNEASARVDELAKNIDELNKLAESSTTSTPPSGTSVPASDATPPVSASSAAPAAPDATPGIVVAGASPTTTAPASAEAATGTATATEPGSAASSDIAIAATAPTDAAALAAAPVLPAAVAPAAPVSEPSMIDSILEEPLIPGIVLILLLLLGYGGYRYTQNRRDAGALDSSFLESRLQPDSFFGSSGGQQVDTTGNTSGISGSSLAFSHSQLDVGGDVDPVAEADVYLAYGRDLQAEEILKEAVRLNPDRLSVHTKLADIYAKRKDHKALEMQAREISRITDGQGSEWIKVCELGRELDPENRYYQPSQMVEESPEFSEPSGFSSNFGAAEGPLTLPPDLDLNLDLPDGSPRTPTSVLSASQTPGPNSSGGLAAAALAAAIADVKAAPHATPSTLSDQLRQETTQPKQSPVWAPPSAAVSATASEENRQAFTPEEPSHTLDFVVSQPADTEPAALDPMPDDTFKPSNSGLMEFDLSTVSLDLEPTTERGELTSDMAPTEAAPLQDGPFATKMALAREFTAIGDNDGARTLLEEVIADSSGDVKAQARRLLDTLN